MAKGATQFRMMRCCLDGVQAVAAATRHSFPRHWHEQYGIGLIDRGAQISQSGRGMVEAGAGNVITVNPGEVHDGSPITADGRSWRMLYFDPGVIDACVADISGGRVVSCELVEPVVDNALLAASFTRLFARVTASGEDARLAGEGELLEILAGLLRGEMTVQRCDAPPALRQAMALIDDQPERAVGLADLARVSGLSRFQVLRAFARETGLTPHAYLMQRRIDRARRLITTGLPLADVAALSGFADQSHMTRLFVRTFGVSPGVYAAAVR